MEITPQGQPKCASSSGQSHRTLRFHCSIPQIFLLPRSFLLDVFFYVGIGIIQKKRDRWWLYWLLILHNSRTIYTKNQPLPFSKLKPSRYVCNCWSHPWRSSMKKKEHLPPSKTNSTAAAKSRKTKAAFLVTGQETRLSSLSLRSFHPPPLPISPSLARSLWPNDGVSRQWQSWIRVEAFYLDINSDEFKVTVKYHQDFLLDDMSLKKLSGMSWGGKSSTSSHFLKIQLASCCQNSPKPKKPSKWWF